jgi:hypothetical protein
MKTFFSGLTFLLSTLAFLLSGFTAYKVFMLDQELDALRSTSAQTPPTSAPPASSYSSAPPVSNGTTTAIQPGQFIQPTLENKGQVELLSVKRIKDPETGTRDVINVQFRVRRSDSVRDEDLKGINPLHPSDTKARNPETSETFKALEGNKATGTVWLYEIAKGTSVDAYVWLKVPEGTKSLDLFVEHTQAFKNVPIS